MSVNFEGLNTAPINSTPKAENVPKLDVPPGLTSICETIQKMIVGPEAQDLYKDIFGKLKDGMHIGPSGSNGSPSLDESKPVGSEPLPEASNAVQDPNGKGVIV